MPNTRRRCRIPRSLRHELIAAREKLRLNRREFAGRAGFSTSFVFRVELGQGDPSYAAMRQWTDALGGGSLDLFRRPENAKDRRRRGRVAEQQTAAE